MTEAEAARRRLDMYLGEVRGTLRGLDPAEVDEILAELRSHVLDRIGGEAGLSEQAVQAALGGLGAPRALGAGYLGQRMVARVERSRSPWRILAAVYRLASFSIGAFLLFCASLIGYSLGGGLILVALLKPFMPHGSASGSGARARTSTSPSAPPTTRSVTTSWGGGSFRSASSSARSCSWRPGG